jgi:cytoskeletal protein RodZ
LSAANAASSAVANAILYDLVPTVANIPASPVNNDAVEVVNSTGIQSFTPLANIPAGFTGNSGLSVRLVYTTSGSTWNWIQYFPNDPETRYATLSDSRLTDTRTPTDGSVTNVKVAAGAAIDPSKIAGTAVVTSDSRLSDTRTPIDGSVTTAKINDLAVTTGKIADASVTSTKLADNAVTTGKIANASVTGAKLAANAVSPDKLSSGDGQAGQVLTTNGSGTLSWSTPAGYRWATALKF